MRRLEVPPKKSSNPACSPPRPLVLLCLPPVSPNIDMDTSPFLLLRTLFDPFLPRPSLPAALLSKRSVESSTTIPDDDDDEDDENMGATGGTYSVSLNSCCTSRVRRAAWPFIRLCLPVLLLRPVAAVGDDDDADEDDDDVVDVVNDGAVLLKRIAGSRCNEEDDDDNNDADEGAWGRAGEIRGPYALRLLRDETDTSDCTYDDDENDDDGAPKSKSDEANVSPLPLTGASNSLLPPPITSTPSGTT